MSAELKVKVLSQEEVRQVYQLGKLLHQGRYNSVYLATFGNETVVVKRFPKAFNEFCRNELQVLSKLNHPRIIKSLGSLECAHYIHIFYPYYSQGDFFEYIDQNDRIPETEGKEYVRQMIEILRYLHIHGYVHADIKLENLLLSESGLVMCDFDTARHVSEGLSGFPGGSKYNIAPELLKRPVISYDHRIDIWSFGVCVFQMLTKYSAFYENNLYNLTESILKTEPIYPKSMSQEAKDFLQRLLKKKPEERMSLDEALNHPWFKTD